MPVNPVCEGYKSSTVGTVNIKVGTPPETGPNFWYTIKITGKQVLFSVVYTVEN